MSSLTEQTSLIVVDFYRIRVSRTRFFLYLLNLLIPRR